MDFSNITTQLVTNTTHLLTTTTASSNNIPHVWGYVCILVAVLFFGSNFLPVKQFETGDGMFFQLILCVAIWTVGFVVNCIQGFPKFYALSMLGGVFWCTGNINTVIIIKCIGLGLGLLIWATTSLVFGWAIVIYIFFNLFFYHYI